MVDCTPSKYSTMGEVFNVTYNQEQNRKYADVNKLDRKRWDYGWQHNSDLISRQRNTQQTKRDVQHSSGHYIFQETHSETRKDRRQHGNKNSKVIINKSISPRSTKMDPIAVATPKIGTITRVAKLEQDAEKLFCMAYGLNGYIKIPHEEAIPKWIDAYKCSRMAIYSLLYGNTYSTHLQQWRNQVKNYSVQPRLFNISETEIKEIPYASFDGNIEKVKNDPLQSTEPEIKKIPDDTFDGNIEKPKNISTNICNHIQDHIQLLTAQGLKYYLVIRPNGFDICVSTS